MIDIRFEEIVLSKEELLALKELDSASKSHKALLVEQRNKAVFERLCHFGLAGIHPCTKSPNGTTLSFPLPKQSVITERGRDYLAYLGQAKKERRRISRHEIVLYFISATAGAAFTLFVEHLGDILRFLQSLVQQW